MWGLKVGEVRVTDLGEADSRQNGPLKTILLEWLQTSNPGDLRWEGEEAQDFPGLLQGSV